MNMNTNQDAGKKNVTQKLATACLDRCQRLIAHIAKVKANLVAEFKENFEVQDRLLQLAVNEAEALAWETDYPHLVFPTLALEKVKVAANWHERQGLIRRSEPV
ncbi:MAG TPA: hypothetical protein VKJ65_05645, partial [Phycisphaerae bacterium]|nr:hypothetical protein [Phycisphaerae bacterium]